MTGREFKALAYNELARVGKAMCDPRRLELLDLICQSEKNVEWLSGEINLSVASTSHHLQILKASKLASTRKQKRFVYYRATGAGMAVWKSLVDIGHDHLSEIKLAVASFFDSEHDLRGVEIAELREMARKNEILLLDVRPPDEYEAGHFPGAVSLPVRALEEQMESLPKGKPVVAYCRGPFCILSKEAVGIVRTHGISAYRLAAGVVDWRIDEEPVVEENSLRREDDLTG